MGIDMIRSILPLSHGISISGARNISDLISAPPINSSAVYSHRFMAYPMRSFRQIDGVPHLSTDLPSRNLVERFFNIIKHFRAIATRYEKTARNFLAGLHLVCTLAWLKWRHALPN